ncbi:DExH-box ATP-dependent RNA helicase DExH5, mitochondrial [Vitis vinifera]|uniref:RNA helicase n=1 Tax=Vitis vinifera TaxID=29760 RepID=A0A438C155_VITVI|nr:DExH-box ATP-dependent RNA helicase DExH5, mitochondrial [Vitis vinifera]
MQRLIFDEPRDGVRKIVLATNIAETSITINDVVFVVDCGKAKETSYDALNNTPCLLPSWISKVSAQQSLCLQIKSLKLGSISEFLSRALQSPELLAVQNAIEYLKIIGALDENENLTVLGRHLTMLPMEPKLGKMLILGAVFNCLDPILTIVAGLSVRDPFLTPLDKKDVSPLPLWVGGRCMESPFMIVVHLENQLKRKAVEWEDTGMAFACELVDFVYLKEVSSYNLLLAEAAKAQFSHDYSDHLALVRAYEGWKDAEKDQIGYEYCWKNFLSAQSMKAIDSLRKEFFSLLKDTDLVDGNMATYNAWSYDEHLIRAVICCGLYPGICSVVQNEKSFSLKTMEDGQVLLHSNSVNARECKIPYPWLVFNEKIKVNSVFLRDSTAVSDSVLLLFGGDILRGDGDGHLKMLGGYLEFFMKPAIAEMYQSLRRELDELIQNKLLNPRMGIHMYHELLSAVRLLISEDQCDGRFVFSHQSAPDAAHQSRICCTYLQDKAIENNQFRSTVEFNGMQIMGQPCNNKKFAEKDAAAEALQLLMGGTQSGHEYIDHMSMLLKKSKKDHK